jgi:hypothetical protein
MLVHPLGFDMYVNVEPLLRSTFPAAPELSIQVLLLMVVTQRQPDHREDLPIIAGGIVKVPEQTGIKRNPEPTFTQHAKAVERCDGIQVQVDQFTPEIVQDGNEEFAWRKTKPSHKMRFKIDDDGLVDRWKFQISGGRDHPTW